MRPDPDETEKRTNEIGTILPLLETVPDIAGHTVTTDALLTHLRTSPSASRIPSNPSRESAPAQ